MFPALPSPAFALMNAGGSRCAEGHLRLSTVREWLARRAIGDEVGYGLVFSCYRVAFENHICWSRRAVGLPSGFLVTPGLSLMGETN